MYGHILFPTDGGPGTEQAMERAFEIARSFDATLHILYVLDREPLVKLAPGEENELGETLDKLGQEITLVVQERAKELGLDAVRGVREGAPYLTIIDYVDEYDIDLVVMGTRGRVGGGERYLGSTTQRVLTRSDVPVITIALEETETDAEHTLDTLDRIVIPTDGSDAAERAAEHALDVAEQSGADVRVVYVVDITTYGYEDAPRSIVGHLKQGGRNAVETVAAEARDREIPVSTAVLRGVPEDSVLQYAHGAEADLIAMGAHGQTGDERLLGSTTVRVVRRSTIPVLTVR